MVTKTSSTVALHAGEHLFKVVGHSQVKGSNTRLTSGTFRVGGHDWAILYYPNGDSTRIVDDQFTSIYLQLVNTGDAEVTASFSFCLPSPAVAATGEKHHEYYSGGTAKFVPVQHDGFGTDKFVSKADMVTSGCLKDDCLRIKCTVLVIASRRLIDDPAEDSIIVPPSVLSKDLGNLLQTGHGAELTVRIGWFSSFKVHGCILAARSTVFRAQLCGFMMESKQTCIRVNDVDAKAFEVLLYYMYNDYLPEFVEEATVEAVNMTQHLLVAADRYAIERLKVMCEAKLSETVEVETVGFTLDLAERFHCQRLKDYCLKYIVRDDERLRAIVKTKMFERLKQNHPRIADDILNKVIEKL